MGMARNGRNAGYVRNDRQRGILVTVTPWCALGGAQAKEIEMEIEESKELEG